MRDDLLSPAPAALALARGFGQQVQQWALEAGAAPEDALLAARAAQALSLATSEGHVCVRIDALGDAAALRAGLLRSQVAGTPQAPGARPLILDAEGRLYLHRYFDYERRLAHRLAQARLPDAPGTPGTPGMPGTPGTTPEAGVAPRARALLRELFAGSPARRDGAADWQQVAAALALRSPLLVVSGGPGTGKTTTVAKLLGCLLAQAPHSRIALAAPTGKAAARLAQTLRERGAQLPPDLRARLPAQSFTVHHLLGARGDGMSPHAGRLLPIDVLVVDEASMLDLALAVRLLEAVPPTARVVLLGDKDQLAAVEAGAVFAALSADPRLSPPTVQALAALCELDPAALAMPAPAPALRTGLTDRVVWLRHDFRFAEAPVLGRLAQAVNAGDAARVLETLRAGAGAATDMDTDTGADTGAGAGAGANAGAAAGAGRDANAAPRPPAAGLGTRHLQAGADAPLCWLPDARAALAPATRERLLAGFAPYVEALRRDPRDAAAVTAALDRFRVLAALREGPRGAAALDALVAAQVRRALGGDEAGADPAWFPGRAVMVTRNDALARLHNGDVGIALPGADGTLRVMFPDGESFRAVAPARLPPHQGAFALTVHKAQGSEFEAVMLVLPSRPGRVLSRELLYTGLTRARARVTLVASADVVEAAVLAPTLRCSGLAARLREATEN